jgi:hypothetical protein
MAQTQKVGKVATSITRIDGNISVKYHQTEVVAVNNGKITLNTGGWWTVTTKARMNQASNQFNLGYHVHQKDGEWFVTYNDETIPFPDEKIQLN